MNPVGLLDWPMEIIKSYEKNMIGNDPTLEPQAKWLKWPHTKDFECQLRD